VASSGFVDPEAPDYPPKLRDSARDLRRVITQHYAPLFCCARVTFVDFVEQADVALEVLGRSVRETGGTEAFVVPLGFHAAYGASYPTWQTVLFVRLTAGNYVKDLVGGGGRTWTESAFDAGEQIARWIDANHDQIVAKRAGKLP
jgi:hypothetical protein